MEGVKRSVDNRRRKPDIFLSHSSKDKVFVRELADRLTKLGVDPWFDEWELGVGDQLHRSIGDALRRSKYVGLVLTPSALKSKWFLDEMHEALAIENSVGRKLILPLLCKQAVAPPFILDRLYLDFSVGYYPALLHLCGIVHGASAKRIADVVHEYKPQTFEDVQHAASHIGWDGTVIVDSADYADHAETLRALGYKVGRSGFLLPDDLAERVLNAKSDRPDLIHERIERLLKAMEIDLDDFKTRGIDFDDADMTS
jgi:hypothetical protein